MAPRLRPDASVPKNVRRLARRDLDRALAALAAPADLGLADTVHDVRKRCKRVRAVLRLARPGLGKRYAPANRDVRDAARALSSLRDAHALLATFDDLVAATHGDRLPGDALGAVREGLARGARRAEAADPEDALEEAGRLLSRARDGVGRWSPPDDPAILVEGLVANHARARRAFRAARAAPDDAALHEWRKRAKYGWHQARLLEPLAPSVLRPMAARLSDLSDGLGDDHDLAVLRASIAAAPAEFGGDAAAAEALALVDATRADLQDRCVRLGARLYAERPAALGRRVRGYWTAWDTVGRERPVGSIADLAHEPADRPAEAADVVAG